MQSSHRLRCAKENAGLRCATGKNSTNASPPDSIVEETDSSPLNHKLSFTTPSCCSVAQGALVGTSVAASLGCTTLLSTKSGSTSSPLTSASIWPLISTQG